MRTLRIIGIVFIALGIGSYFIGRYIANEVLEGRKEIRSGQKKVDAIRGFTGLVPVTKEVGEAATADGQRQIDEGRITARHYAIIANTLHIIGIIVFLAGVILIIISFFVPRRQRHH